MKKDRLGDGDRRIYYEHTGGTPLMAFTHGYMSNGTYFGEQREHFRHGCGTVIYDVCGFGDSGKPLVAAEYMKDRFVDDLESIILTCCPDPQQNPVVLVGHSMGTIITVEFADRHPEWVKAIVLVAGTYNVKDSMAQMMSGAGYLGQMTKATVGVWNSALTVLDPFNLGRFNPLLHGSNRLDFSDQRFKEMGDLEFLYEIYRSISYEDIRVAMLVGEQILGWDCREAASRITVPTLLIHGTHDQFLPVSSAEEFADMIPGADLKIIEGAHHGIAYQKYKEVNALMENFLIRIGTD